MSKYTLGIATAYGAAVRGGYTGTYDEWCALMADYATVGEEAQQAAQSIQDMGVEAESLPPDSSATVSKSVDPQTGAVTLDFGIPRGATGEPGPQGERGLTGDTGPAGPTGPAGDNGISPTITITDITGGHRVTITDATGAHSFDVMDGDAGDAPVQDVQINDTSILDAQGVANVPVAGPTTLGVVKANAVNGVQLSSTNTLITVKPSDSEIKGASDNYKIITTYLQHKATFYGLAKAAGDTTQSQSDNAVGTYTDEAKAAIQKMLGIYEAPWELIREDTFTNATEADYDISVDANGQSFELTDAILMFETPKQNNASGFGGSGIIRFIGNTSSLDTYPGPYTQEANANARGGNAFLERKAGGLIVTKYKAQSSDTNGGNLGQRFYSGFNTQGTPVRINANFYVETVRIIKITGTCHYVLYGKRKWN